MDIQIGEPSGTAVTPLGSPSRAPSLRSDVDSRALREEIVARWLRAKRLKSRNTEQAYARDIETFFAWCDARELDVFTLFGPDIEEYTEWLSTTDNYGRYKSRTKPRAKSTVARMVTVVSSFYSYAGRHTHGRVGNPVELAERVKPDPDSLTRALSLGEVESLLRVAKMRGLREYAVVQLLVGSAIRVSELCLADTADVGTDSGFDVIEVRRKGGKRATVRIPPASARSLRRYTRGRKGPLFLLDNGERMTRRMVDYRLTQLARQAGIVGRKERLSPHCLRHTAATLALDAGASLRDVQVQMGHSSPETTARYDKARRNIKNAAAVALAAIVEDGDDEAASGA